MILKVYNYKLFILLRSAVPGSMSGWAKLYLSFLKQSHQTTLENQHAPNIYQTLHPANWAIKGKKIWKAFYLVVSQIFLLFGI